MQMCVTVLYFALVYFLKKNEFILIKYTDHCLFLEKNVHLYSNVDNDMYVQSV